VLPEAVIFDFDGLVIDTETVEYQSARLVWAEYGAELGLDRWLPIVGSAHGLDWIGELIALTGQPLDRAELLEERRRHVGELVALAPILPGVLDLLDEAAAARIPCAVASNSPAAWVEGHLDRLGLTHRFVAVVTVDQVAQGKPHPEPYQLAVAMAGAAPARSVALEDSEIGVAAASAAGLYTVGVPGPMSLHHDLGAADLVVSSLTQVDLERLAQGLTSRTAA
jgi:HAD superfamily hydrolase (TIGR01509 family)